jgi:hypothetical protein
MRVLFRRGDIRWGRMIEAYGGSMERNGERLSMKARGFAAL